MGLFTRLQAKHNLVLKLLLVISISVVFAWLIPTNQVDFHNVDEFDSVWPYKDLIIECDFAIKKPQDQIEKEQKEIVAGSPLIFVVNNSDRDEKLEKFNSTKASNPQFYNALRPLLDSVYKVGIIQAQDEANSRQILVQSEMLAQQGSYSGYFTIATASEFIKQRLEKSNAKLSFKNNEYEDFLALTILFDKDKTERYLESLISNISVYKAVYSKGDKLVEQGEALTKEKREIIGNYFELRKKNTGLHWTVFVGRFGLFFMLNIILLMYLFFFRKTVFGQNLQIAFLYLCLFTAFISTYFFYKYGLMLTALPFVLVPIMVRVFFDSRTALFTHLIAVLACSFFMPDKMEFVFLQLITGIGILFSISEMRKRQQIMNAALIAIFFYCLLFVFYNLGFGTKQLVTKFSAYLPYLISGGLVLLATPLIFITEKIFGFVSDFKLLELCDLNQPLLRDLSQQIPGTFQHSMQVANLAEEAIFYIGGNTLLVRAGAMYHDVGKIMNPSYFTENQGGNVSPHIEMQPRESAKIIIQHVIDGIELAKKHKLPEQIIDFIRTHHGTTTVGFFLHMQKKEHLELTFNEDDFRYPGPIPFSKETAVLMLADGVEAASRSLKKHDALTINDLVDQIIDYKINQNQLINADITFKDITLIKKIFKKRLMTIYHARIEYPS